MTAKHTPWPWQIGNFTPSNIYTCSDGPVNVAECRRNADAQFIVRACNAHEDLIAAARAICEPDDGYSFDSRKLKNLRAALAKAEGKA
jgi:hypothetical protein